MDLKLSRQKTTLTRPHSPMRSRRNTNSVNHTKADSNSVSLLLGGESSALSNNIGGGGGVNNSSSNNNNNARTSSTSALRSDSLRRFPYSQQGRKLSGTSMVPGKHVRRKLPSIRKRAVSPLAPRAAVASLKKDAGEHHGDPSPAPAKPPRAPTRHSVAPSPSMKSLNYAPRTLIDQHRTSSAFQSAGERRKSLVAQRQVKPLKRSSTSAGAGTQSSPVSGFSAVGRRPIVLDAKHESQKTVEPRHLMHMTQPLFTLSRGVMTHNHREPCEAADDCERTTVLVSAKRPPTHSGKAQRTGSGDETTPPSIERCSAFLSNGSNGDQKVKLQLASATRLVERTRSSGKVKRSCSGFKSRETAAEAHLSALSSVPSVRKNHLANDTHVEHSVQPLPHARPYQKRMESLKQRERDVFQALERFLILCRKDPSQAGSGGGPKSCSLTALASYANLLTTGLKEMQQCNVALLLCLADCLCEVHQPIGSVGAVSKADVIKRREQGQLEMSTNGVNLLPGSARQKRRPSCSLAGRSDNNSFSMPSPSVPGSKESHKDYLNFLNAEEHFIVQRLLEVCSRVREALVTGPGVIIGDQAMLSSPLFLPSVPRPKQGVCQPVLEGSKKTTGMGARAENNQSFRGHVTPTSGGVESARKRTKNAMTTDESVRTSPSETDLLDPGDCCFPYVGVFLKEWGEMSDDGGSSSQSLRAENPQLVLGGGRRLRTAHPALSKPQSAKAPLHRSESVNVRGVSGKKALAREIFTEKATVTRSKSRTPSRSGGGGGGATGVTDFVAAAHIREAEGIWGALKGIATQAVVRVSNTTLNRDETQSSGLGLKDKTMTRDVLTLVEISSSSVLPLANERRDEATKVIGRFLCRCIQRRRTMRKESQPGPKSAPPSPEADMFSKTALTHTMMATRIQCHWRRYVARKMVKQRREHAEEESRRQQEWHYKTCMAHRLQRLFKGIVARRRWRAAVSEQRERAAPPTPSPSTQAASVDKKSDGKGNVDCFLTARERFERIKETRRTLLHASSDRRDSAAASTGETVCAQLSSATYTVKHEKALHGQQASDATAKIPLLDLKSYCISTFDVENYQSDPENFSVGILHRLLRASKPLLYVIRVICDLCPTEPESALASLSVAEELNSKRRNKAHSHEKQRPLHVKEGVVEDDGGATCASTDAASSSHGVTKDSRAQQRDWGEVQWEVRSYRPICRYLLLRKAATMKDTDATFTYPFSTRVDSFVDEDELRHDKPVKKSFQRPFERWGTAYAFQERAFSAAAVYAWKLIFSHTPHDEYKQRLLKTREEQEARLERVEQRNRMILACYCVRSEREWLQEASKDIGFVGRIWNPKKSLDPDDPDFERNCREAYEFVEDFLYQCFPTVVSLDDVPAFLVGASIFFLLKSVLSYSLDKEEEVRWGEEKEGLMNGDSSAGTNQRGRTPLKTAAAAYDKELPLTQRQQQTVFAYEVLNLLDYVIRTTREGESENAHGRATRSKNDGDDDYNEEEDVMDETNELGVNTMSAYSVSLSLDHSLSAEGADFFLSNSLRARLVQLSRPTCGANGLSSGVSGRGGGVQLGLVYPRGYLVRLSERLTRALFGVDMNLEVCEDLEATG